MSPSAYYVINSADWASALHSIGWAFAVCMALVWAAGVNWWRLDDRIRARLRCRRLRTIRAGRACHSPKCRCEDCKNTAMQEFYHPGYAPGSCVVRNAHGDAPRSMPFAQAVTLPDHMAAEVASAVKGIPHPANRFSRVAP